MPYLQPPGMQQRPYRKCDSGGQSVAYEHDTPFIPPVADHAGKNAQQHIRRIGTHRQKRGGQRGAVLLIRPDDQAEAGHGAAERGKRLGAPKQQERTQTVENFYLFHFGFAPFYREKSSDKNAKPDADSNVSSMRRVRPSDPAWSGSNAKPHKGFPPYLPVGILHRRKRPGWRLFILHPAFELAVAWLPLHMLRIILLRLGAAHRAVKRLRFDRRVGGNIEL